jgi:hypothetical protein
MIYSNNTFGNGTMIHLTSLHFMSYQNYTYIPSLFDIIVKMCSFVFC